MQTATSPSKLSAEEQIRSAPRPMCFLCGSGGTLVHRGLRDRLFGADGSWDLRQCSNAGCGVIWLDPMPLVEDIGKAYANYYTHAAPPDTGRAGLLKRVYRQMKRGYWLGKYGYTVSWQARFPGKLLYLLPVCRNEVDSDARYLDAVPGGRLLDVGCGSGEWLAIMRELGWQVAGLDFDENAVKAARQNGLDVTCGAVEQSNFPDNTFDAVTLNHVIEHVPDPVGTLKECARILKPGGKLVLFTPNSSSLSHRIYKQDWRGLEPPRHLHVFSPRSLPALLKRAGLSAVSLRPQIARSVIYESTLLKRGTPRLSSAPERDRSASRTAAWFNLAEVVLLKLNPSVADCVGAIAVKG